MVQTEVVLFTVLITCILLSFIVGIFAFIFQYRKRKMIHEAEKKAMEKKYEAELLAAKLEMQELTMKIIGEEIHDNVGQKLTLASLYTQQLEHRGMFPQIKPELENISGIINESLNDLRKLSKDLTYPADLSNDLAQIVEQQCIKIRKLNICHVSFSANEGEYMVPSGIAHVVLRIVQEFFQNSLKHSGCTNLFAEINDKNDCLELELKDDGKGFDINTIMQNNNTGIGLKNMQKRAALAGTSITMESAPGKGSSLLIKIPHSIIQNHHQ